MANDLIVIAVLLGAHGVRGDCRVKSFTEKTSDAFGFGALVNERGDVLVTPKRARPAKDHFVVTPEEFRQKEEWDGLKGTLLYVSRAALPEAAANEVYIDELVGISVFDAGDVLLGKVKAVHNFGAGDLLEIDPAEGGKSVLVPFTEEDVPEVDLAAARIIVTTYNLWADETDDRAKDEET